VTWSVPATVPEFMHPVKRARTDARGAGPLPEEQAAEGYSLDAQRAKLAGYAVAADLELVSVLADEGLSGKRTDNRPDFRKPYGGSRRARRRPSSS
jgi:hypothetical protein